jgi:hypothetical protein
MMRFYPSSATLLPHGIRLGVALLSGLVLAGSLTGCGGNLVAPEGAASNAFLDQVAARCGKLSVGSEPINYRLNVDGDDTTFLDETAKLGAGTIDAQTYANDINSFYPMGNNQAAIDCVIGLVE